MIGNVLRKTLSRPLFQPVFTFLHKCALVGMNYHNGAAVSESGERAVLSSLVDELGAAPTIFDVGANTGGYAVEVLSAFKQPRLYCFEPASSAFERLEMVVGARAHCFHIGLGQSDEAGMLFDAGAATGTLFGTGKGEEIRLRRLDDFCREEGISRIDLLKLDVEGNELSALKGCGSMLGPDIDYIQFEFGGPSIEAHVLFKDLFDLLSSHYDIYRILAHGTIKVSYDATAENFITANYLAVARRLLNQGDGSMGASNVRAR